MSSQFDTIRLTQGGTAGQVVTNDGSDGMVWDDLPCLDTVVTDDRCALGATGNATGLLVRRISVSGCNEITEELVGDHYTVSQKPATGSGLDIPTPTVGTYFGDVSVTITQANPSPCRLLRGIVDWFGAFNFQYDGQNLDYAVRRDGVVIGQRINNFAGLTGGFSDFISNRFVQNILPGGVYSATFDQRVTVIARTSATATWIGRSISALGMWSTTS